MRRSTTSAFARLSWDKRTNRVSLFESRRPSPPSQKAATPLMSQFRERCFDACENWTLAELREYPFCLCQVLKRERVLFLGFVQETEDHLGAAYMLPGAIEQRILHDLRRQSVNARRPCEPHAQNNRKMLQ
jgi:hypothetical protein